MAATATEHSAPFVGRDVELSLLHRHLAEAINRERPKTVLIRGDYGIGKTTLVEHFVAEAVRQEPSLVVGRGQCAMETRDEGLRPVIQIFTDLTAGGIDWKFVGSHVWDFAKKVAPAWLDIVTAGAATAIATTIEEGSRLIKVSQPKVSQDSVFVQFTNLLEALAKKRPVLVFIDDLQWADESSLRLLFHLGSRLKEGPILILGTYRPVEAMETATHAPLFREVRANLLRLGASEIELETGIDVAAYLQQRYPHHAFPPELVSQVQQQSDGHPLLLSQLFSWWEEEGIVVIEPTDGTVGEARLTSRTDRLPSIPPTVGAILDERIRLVGDELRDILVRASVEGDDFTAQTIIRLLGLDELEVYEEIEILERNYQLVEQQDSRQIGRTVFDFYRFAHRFFREHIYGQLSGGRRRILHRQVGDCLERLYPDPEPIAGQLAQHFHEARQPLKAARYALMAAQREQKRYAWVEAERWCLLGLSEIAPLPESAEISHLRLDLMEASGNGQYYWEDYRLAHERQKATIELAQQLGADPVRIAKMCVRMADICDELESGDEVLEGWDYIRMGKQILESHTIPFGEVHVELAAMEGLLLCRLDRYDDAVQVLHRVLDDGAALPETPSLNTALAWGWEHLGIALSYLNRYGEAVQAYQHGHELATRAEDLFTAAYCLTAVAEDSGWLGRFDQAEEAATQALEAFRMTGSRGGEAYILEVLGFLCLLQGKLEEAVRVLPQAIDLMEETGSLGSVAAAYAELALAQLGEGNVDAANGNALHALEIDQGSKRGMAYALDALGRIAAHDRRWAEVDERFEGAIALYDEIQDRHHAAWVRRHYAEALIRKGEVQRAGELLASVQAVFEELELPHEVLATRQLLQGAAQR